MSTTYPDEAVFILSDDIIEEAKTKKMTIVGCYIGDSILFENKEVEGKALGQISILTKFRGGAGEYKIVLKLTSPSGKELINGEQDNKKTEKDNMLVGLKISPFVIKEFGTYEYEVKLDNTKEYRYNFFIGPKEE